MGEIADGMLDGTLCCHCGVYLGEDWRDVPTLCKKCAKDPEIRKAWKGASVSQKK